MSDAFEWNRRLEDERKSREAEEAREQARRDAANGYHRPFYSHPAYKEERNRLENSGQDRAPSGWSWWPS